MAEEKRGCGSISTIIITIIAILIIIALAFFYYYFLSQPYPVESPPVTVAQTPPVKNTPVTNVPVKPEPPPEPPAFSTQVIIFLPPEILPAEIKAGDCQINSIAQPYRADAFKCIVGKTTYDPCFSTALADIVYCKMNPLRAGNDFLIKLSKPLPAPLVPQNINSSWAWFLLLNDGEETFCGPYTGTRPIAGGEVAYYGCKINENKELVALLGDIKKGQAWTAQKAILVKRGAVWTVKSSQEVNIKIVWQ